MINAVVHILTNSASGFASEAIPDSETYLAHEEKEGETYLRDFLKLRVSENLYYLQGICAAVYAFPEILCEFNEKNRSFSFSDLNFDSFLTRNAHLVTKFGKIANVSYHPTEFPVPTTTKIKFLDTISVIFARGTEKLQLGYARRTGNYLDIDWPKDCGIGGVVYLGENTWSEHQEVSITHAPISFPYKNLSEKLVKDEKIVNFLDEMELFSSFFAAQTSLERAALVGLALRRCHE